MGPENFWGSGMWLFPMIMIIIMLIFVFGRGRFGPPWMQRGSRHHNETPEQETPLEILKKRYAKGEITKEEFDNMKKDL
ncbi:MAG: SHOCT domain-containing protein [Leptospirales bacterium]